MRGREKAQKLAVAGVGVLPVDVDGKRVIVRDVHVDEHGRLVCTVQHKDIPDEANPFIFVNPPLQVLDGTQVREDHDAAFRQVVADAVRAIL